MRIIYRYLLKGFLPPFFIGWGVFFFLFVIGNIFPLLKILGKEGMELAIFYKVFFLTFFVSLPYSISCGFLTGVMGIMGNSKREGGILTLEISGIRKSKILLPFLLISILLSFFLLFFFLYPLPKSNYNLKCLLYKGKKFSLEEGVFLDNFKNYVVFIKKMRGKKVQGITLYKLNEEGKPSRVINAKDGEYTVEVNRKRLNLTLFKGWIDEFDVKRGESIKGKFDKYSVSLSIRKLSLLPYKTLPDLTIKEINKRIKESKSLRLKIFEAEKGKRFSLSFIPLLFSLWGSLIGMRFAERGKWQALTLSFPVIAGIYLIFLLGEALFMKGFHKIFLYLPYILTFLFFPFYYEKTL